MLWLVENAFSPIEAQQLTSGTSAATHKLMEPHCYDSFLKLNLLEVSDHSIIQLRPRIAENVNFIVNYNLNLTGVGVA